MWYNGVYSTIAATSKIFINLVDDQVVIDGVRRCRRAFLPFLSLSWLATANVEILSQLLLQTLYLFRHLFICRREGLLFHCDRTEIGLLDDNVEEPVFQGRLHEGDIFKTPTRVISFLQHKLLRLRDAFS